MWPSLVVIALPYDVMTILKAVVYFWMLLLEILNQWQIDIGRFVVEVVTSTGKVGKHVINGLKMEIPIVRSFRFDELA